MMVMNKPHDDTDYQPTEEDAYLEFCAENWLDPDSKYAMKLWDEQISGQYLT